MEQLYLKQEIAVRFWELSGKIGDGRVRMHRPRGLLDNIGRLPRHEPGFSNVHTAKRMDLDPCHRRESWEVSGVRLKTCVCVDGRGV